MYEILQQLYPNRIVSPMTIEDIPNNGYMVYILVFNNSPIVLGIGKNGTLNNSSLVHGNRRFWGNFHVYKYGGLGSRILRAHAANP